MTLRALPLLACAALVVTAAPRSPAQAGSPQSRITAHLSSGVVKLGSQVRLVIAVEDAEEARILALPEVRGLQIGPAGAPQSQSMLVSVNGRVTRSRTLSWVVPVRPLEVGEFKIPPVELEVGGRAASTDELALKVVEDLKGEELGFFTVQPSALKLVEGQPFSLELRFGFDAGLAGKVNFLDLLLPWWDELPGMLEMEAPPGRSSVQRVAARLNSRLRIEVEELGLQTLRERPFALFRLVRSYTPTRAGRIEFPTSFFEFGRDVQGDFFAPARRAESYFVKADGFELDVVPLPEEGRPIDFGGAVGELSARASAEPRDVDEGESIKLSVEWTGAGNLEFFSAPDPARIDAFRGFRVYGTTEEKEFDRRTVVYDLAPLSSDVQSIPPLPLPVYDPGLGRYVEVATQPIAIRVRKLEGAARLALETGERTFERDIEDIAAAPRGERARSGPGARAVAGALALIPLLALGLRGVARRRGDPDAPLERRRRRALRELKRALAESRARSGEGGECSRATLDALYAFLAARTREAPQAWVGRDAEAFARGSGRLDEARARALAQLVLELERAAWGGAPPPPAARVAALAEDLVRGGL